MTADWTGRPDRKYPTAISLPPGCTSPAFSIVEPMTKPDIDFADTSTFKQAKKPKKGAQKQTWNAESGDEGNKDAGGGGDGEGGDAGGGGTGGGGGDGNNGDGGAGGDDGGGGDEWNDWGAGKKGKKGKKAKEEEKKKQEEEERKKKEEEEKKKEEEEAEAEADAPGGSGNPLSWADEDPGDDWGTFTAATSKKDKKDKKKKVCLTPYMEAWRWKADSSGRCGGGDQEPKHI